MPAKETAAARKRRIAALLADYDAANRDYNKAKGTLDRLKPLVGEVDNGTYGEWIRDSGTPRQIKDNDAIVERFRALGEPVPMKLSNPPIVVKHKAD